MKKFTIHIPHQEIHYLWNRLALSRWFGFSYKQWDKGIPTNYLSRIAVQWQDWFDWQQPEA